MVRIRAERNFDLICSNSNLHHEFGYRKVTDLVRSLSKRKKNQFIKNIIYFDLVCMLLLKTLAVLMCIQPIFSEFHFNIQWDNEFYSTFHFFFYNFGNNVFF